MKYINIILFIFIHHIILYYNRWFLVDFHNIKLLILYLFLYISYVHLRVLNIYTLLFYFIINMNYIISIRL